MVEKLDEEQHENGRGIYLRDVANCVEAVRDIEVRRMLANSRYLTEEYFSMMDGVVLENIFIKKQVEYEKRLSEVYDTIILKSVV